MNLKYAEQIGDEIFILSAKHHLLDLDREIEPYDLTLNKMSKNKRQKWAEKVLNNLKLKTDLNNDEFIFLAGKKYREFLSPYINNYKIPMRGLGIGKQLKFLKQNVS